MRGPLVRGVMRGARASYSLGGGKAIASQDGDCLTVLRSESGVPPRVLAAPGGLGPGPPAGRQTLADRPRTQA